MQVRKARRSLISKLIASNHPVLTEDEGVILRNALVRNYAEGGRGLNVQDLRALYKHIFPQIRNNVLRIDMVSQLRQHFVGLLNVDVRHVGSRGRSVKKVIKKRRVTNDRVKTVPTQHGLVLGTNNVITSISGPVSMRLLKHPDPNYPVIILFGDKHESKANQCENCGCSAIATNTKCCTTLDDVKHFLKPLDRLAEQYGPVDIFTESFPGGNPKMKREGFLADMVGGKDQSGDLGLCYYHAVQQNEKGTCPTNNIRWHGGDIRDSSNTLSVSDRTRAMLKNEQYLNVRTCNLVEGTLIATYNMLDRLTQRSELEGFTVRTVLSMLISLPQQKVVDILKNEFPVECRNDTMLVNGLSFWREFLNKLIGENATVISIVDAVDHLFHTLNVMHGEGSPWKSSLLKQIEKQRFDILKGQDIWKTWLTKSIEMSPRKGLDPVNNTTYTDMKGILFDEKTVASMDRYIAFDVQAGLVDVYTLARLFKQPTEGRPCKLAICYFGNWHIRNMKNMLLEIGYICTTIQENSSGDSTDGVRRCIDINERIDLPSLLQQVI